MQFVVKGNLVDIWQKQIYTAEIQVHKAIITGINKIAYDASLPYILPGFIDSHVHIESSLLVPSEFARIAVTHGTVATVSDPHEIANVCGIDGVNYMIEDGKKVPFKFFFGAPSCVPATDFETAGATISTEEISTLLQRNEIKYLSEMMNFPGVLNKEEEVVNKIKAAIANNKPIDGHAPGLMGNTAKQYIYCMGNDGGVIISTDHECFTKEEALQKLQLGMKILIREGSAAKNFDALIDLLNEYPDKIMFCSDDKHPDSLLLGHINQLCARAVAKGIDIFKVLQAACINPIIHYSLEVGMLRVGDCADFITTNSLKNFEVIDSYIDGKQVVKNGKSLIATQSKTLINHFNIETIIPEDLVVSLNDFPKNELGEIPVIQAIDGQLITNKTYEVPFTQKNCIVSNIVKDVLKIVVVNRYKKSSIAKAFIQNFGLKNGAIASSVAHDSHNIVAIGVSDEAICTAINLIINSQGGLSAVMGDETKILPLPIAGLMSNDTYEAVSENYISIDSFAKEKLGCKLAAPFMSLSFMCLLVIPSIKLSDKGLFDGTSFSFIK